MLRNRQTSLQELCDQEDFLTKLNQELIKTIQDMEDSSALKMRRMLQQQDIFGVRPHHGPAAPPLPCRLGPAHHAALLSALAPSPGLSRPVAHLLLPSGRYNFYTLCPYLSGLWNQTRIGGSS